MSMLRAAVMVVIAGVVGTVANSAVVAALTPNAFVPLAISPGRLAVAIVVAAFLPVAFQRWSQAVALVASLAFLTVVPSILAKLVFGIGAPWPFVLAMNGVYAVAALIAYVVADRAIPLRTGA